MEGKKSMTYCNWLKNKEAIWGIRGGKWKVSGIESVFVNYAD